VARGVAAVAAVMFLPSFSCRRWAVVGEAEAGVVVSAAAPQGSVVAVDLEDLAAA